MPKWPISINGLNAAVPHLCSIFAEAGCIDANRLAGNICSQLNKAFDAVNSAKEASRIGLDIYRELVERNLVCRFDEVFMMRNFRMANMVAPHLEAGQSILDVQTGNGFVATMISEMRQDCRLSLTDEVDERHPMCRNLPWIEKPDNQFDSLLFLTVLHHCGNPEKVFRQYTEYLRSGGTIVLVENTFRGGDLSEKDVNVFFDWFFHNCVHPSDYPCPNTHKSIEEWTEFLKAEGFEVKVSKDLGRFPMVKVLHHLWIAQKK